MTAPAFLPVSLASAALRPPDRDQGARHGVALSRVAENTGCGGVWLAAPWTMIDVPALVAATLPAGLSLAGALGPLPAEPLAAGRRLPELLALPDKEERLAAIELSTKLAAAVADAGGEHLALDLGQVPLFAPEGKLAERFARRELFADDHPPDRLFEDLKAERTSLSARVLDAARFSLDRLLRGFPGGLRLSLRPAGSLFEAGSPREIAELLRDFDGSGLGVAFDTGRWAVLDTLGLVARTVADSPSPLLGEMPWDSAESPAVSDRRASLFAATRIFLAHDAAGLDAALTPGLGEVDFRGMLAGFVPAAAAVSVVLGGRADTTAAELRRARDLMAGAFPSPPAPSSDSPDASRSLP